MTAVADTLAKALARQKAAVAEANAAGEAVTKLEARIEAAQEGIAGARHEVAEAVEALASDDGEIGRKRHAQALANLASSEALFASLNRLMPAAEARNAAAVGALYDHEAAVDEARMADAARRAAPIEVKARALLAEVDKLKAEIKKIGGPVIAARTSALVDTFATTSFEEDLDRTLLRTQVFNLRVRAEADALESATTPPATATVAGAVNKSTTNN